MRIAVDAMGGDHAPSEIVKGCIAAIKEYDLEICLVGDEDRLKDELKKYNCTDERIMIEPSTDVVEMCEAPAIALRKKPKSSIMVATNLVKNKKADAVISAGNTGAAMASAKLRLRSIEGVERPAIATILPSEKGQVILLDVGANVDCKPKHLVHFALMGSIYAEKVWGVENPRVGLLNIGEEEGKGDDLCNQTYGLLKNSNLNFIGNVEGRDITRDKADVVVCDGFVGNVVLKFGEGLSGSIFKLLKDGIKESWAAKLGAWLLKPIFLNLKKKTDYSEYGGAPLLGVNGISIISHGSSKEKAIKNAVRVAKEAVDNKIVERIEEGVANLNIED